MFPLLDMMMGGKKVEVGRAGDGYLHGDVSAWFGGFDTPWGRDEADG